MAGQKEKDQRKRIKITPGCNGKNFNPDKIYIKTLPALILKCCKTQYYLSNFAQKMTYKSNNKNKYNYIKQLYKKHK